MLRYTLERIALLVLTMFLIVTLNFFLLRLDGTTPFENPKITDTQKQFMMEKYGLDKPMVVQYARYLGDLLKGDMGKSIYFQNQPVLELILSKLPHTMRVGLPALVFGVLMGMILGALAAIYRGGFIDNMVTVLAIVFVTIPSFVLAALFQHYLAGEWGLFPYLYSPPDPSRGVTYWDSMYSVIMPALAIGLGIIASVMRFMRSELVEVLNSDYILLARAKGLSKPKVILKHAIRNAMIPVMTIIGPMTLSVIYGSLVIERFFGVPGLSQLMLNAIEKHDYFLTLGVNIFYSFMYIVIVLVIDLLYGVVDPRIRLSGGSK